MPILIQRREKKERVQSPWEKFGFKALESVVAPLAQVPGMLAQGAVRQAFQPGQALHQAISPADERARYQRGAEAATQTAEAKPGLMDAQAERARGAGAQGFAQAGDIRAGTGERPERLALERMDSVMRARSVFDDAAYKRGLLDLRGEELDLLRQKMDLQFAKAQRKGRGGYRLTYDKYAGGMSKFAEEEKKLLAEIRNAGGETKWNADVGEFTVTAPGAQGLVNALNNVYARRAEYSVWARSSKYRAPELDEYFNIGTGASPERRATLGGDVTGSQGAAAGIDADLKVKAELEMTQLGLQESIAMAKDAIVRERLGLARSKNNREHDAAQDRLLAMSDDLAKQEQEARKTEAEIKNIEARTKAIGEDQGDPWGIRR